MKFQLAIILGIFFFHLGNAQITLIPDPNFEQALIDLSIDSDGMINGQVLTVDIEGVILSTDFPFLLLKRSKIR